MHYNPDEKSAAAAAVRFMNQDFSHLPPYLNPIGTDANLFLIGRRESGAKRAKRTEPLISRKNSESLGGEFLKTLADRR